ncbi:glycoside hydrolase family 6 protein [Cellulomonas massiliensis]|uniref:glycoside hydrolase family 6 protein n=1 Tax=Cellulomonas massiliensis TaxID=1465811 RepID=UPI0009DABB36|nr:glycoside hydrolase family 6 protein [Cellulomonas massiliensis]
MRRSTRQRMLAAGAVTALVLGLGAVGTAAQASPGGVAGHQPAPPASDRLYVDVAGTAGRAAAARTGQARADALLIAAQPMARWFTSGTPAEVRSAAKAYVDAAQRDGSVPVLVVYNLPFRDCSQYSAGGAADTAAYEAWVKALAQGIGHRRAMVMIEPDGIGIIPFNTDINGNAEWCRPAEANPDTAVADRYEQLNAAVDAFTANPKAKVYLDGTNSNWLSPGDLTQRLLRAGVERADGWFVNSSNYGSDAMTRPFSSWISQCIDLVTHTWWQPQWCGSQYYPATVSDVSTYALTDAHYADAYAQTGRTADPAAMLHGVVDTSRNGQGYWTAPPGKYTDAETWCNPPGRGLGQAPTLSTGDPYIDANLWIKIPGESDGQCLRGTSGPEDPERGMVDPAAGQWFEEMARELVANAPVLPPSPTCRVTHTSTTPRHGRFVSTVTIRNTGTTTLRGWRLTFAEQEGVRTHALVGARLQQHGNVVTARGKHGTDVIRPGRSVTFVYTGRGADERFTPALHALDGLGCR